MLLESITDSVTGLVLLVGLPLLVALLYPEGLMLGKLLQLPAVFMAVAGQWTVYEASTPSSPN